MSIAKFKLNKLLFLIILTLTVWGFWYFEESLFLRFLVLIIVILAAWQIILQPKKNSHQRFELAGLFTLFLGSFTLYNLLYIASFPLFLVMFFILIAIYAIAYLELQTNAPESFDKNSLNIYSISISIIMLEVFLSLYFWPENPEIKSLILVVMFYLASNFLYLYIHNMLRLRKILGHVIICLIILGIIFTSSWLKIAK